jgi:hypothetical protein
MFPCYFIRPHVEFESWAVTSTPKKLKITEFREKGYNLKVRIQKYKYKSPVSIGFPDIMQLKLRVFTYKLFIKIKP